MAPFVNVTGVLVESELIVQCNSKVFKTADYFHYSYKQLQTYAELIKYDANMMH